GKNGAARNGGIVEASLPTQPPKDWSLHIVGSDLLPSSVRIAERGLYPESALTGLPPTTIRACFSKIGSNGSANGTPAGSLNGSSNGISNGPSIETRNGNLTGTIESDSGSTSASGSTAHLLVKPRLRSLVTFNTMNLTKPVYIGRFDCI